jgi:membrane-bound ClpP family serine protease
MSRLKFAYCKIEKFPEPLVGIVEKTIAHNCPGRVKCIGTTWPAKFYQTDVEATINQDEFVTIVGRSGLTMLVIIENKNQPTPTKLSINT